MEQIAPAGPVYQAGTLSGNPLAMAAGLATLEILREPGHLAGAERWASPAGRRRSRRRAAGVPLAVQRVGTMLTPSSRQDAGPRLRRGQRCDRAAYAAFFHAMLDSGVYLAPSPFEAAFTSSSTAIGSSLLDAALTPMAAIAVVGAGSPAWPPPTASSSAASASSFTRLRPRRRQ